MVGGAFRSAIEAGEKRERIIHYMQEVVWNDEGFGIRRILSD